MPLRYAYGAQSVKCAVCNFVTQARVLLPQPRRAAQPLTRCCAGRGSVHPAAARLDRRCVASCAPCIGFRACMLTPVFASGNRPQPRPQMVVVENPPTMDDEGKMVRPLAVRAVVISAYTACRRCQTWLSAWRRSSGGQLCRRHALLAASTRVLASADDLRFAAHALQRPLTLLRHLPVQRALLAATPRGGCARQQPNAYGCKTRLLHASRDVCARTDLEVPHRVPPSPKRRFAHGA